MTHFIRRYAPLIAATVFAVAVFAAGTQGYGPLGDVEPVRELGVGNDEEASRTTTLPTPHGSTSTTIALSRWDFDPGSCLTWDLSTSRSTVRTTLEVPCDEPHLFEATTSFEVTGSYGPQGPTEEEWNSIDDRECEPRATEYLGYPLDPYGRFYPTMIVPLPESWAAGERRVLCGIGARTSAMTEVGPLSTEPFVGVVKGADQTLLIPVDTCFGALPSTGDGRPLVPCAGPHHFEVVGTFDVESTDRSYPGREAIDEIAWTRCVPVAEALFGGPLPEDVRVGTMGIEESSWTAGRRTAECTMGLIGDTGQWATTQLPLRAD